MNSQLEECNPHWTTEFQELVRSYRNTYECHEQIWTRFHLRVNEFEYLKKHRDFIEDHAYGFGDRAFHYLWKLLVDQMSARFSFLEIGVFKGQILSLIQLLSSQMGKQPRIHGITPLSDAGDKYSRYPQANYLAHIEHVFREFGLSLDSLRLICGLSTDYHVKHEASALAPFDIVYIDGCHDYGVVVDDINTYGSLVQRGGFLVMDDASCYLCLPNNYKVVGRHVTEPEHPVYEASFKGHEDVSRAVCKVLESNSDFVHLFACGHNRVWLRR